LILLTLCLWGSVHEDLELQIAEATRRLERAPRSAGLHLQRAELYRFHEEWDAAREDLRRAARLDPGLDGLDLALGRTEVGAKDGRAAREALDRFLAGHPDHGEARLWRARALLLEGRRTEAVREFTRALELHPEPRPEHYLERADADAEGALAGLEEGIRRLGPLVVLHERALALEIEAGRHEAALARIEAILVSSERRDVWLARRGDVLARAGRSVEACEARTAALAALEALPPRQRRTRSTRELEARLKAALEVGDEDP
jgi:tetratricopeptide (TPR) repeat protein